MRKNVPGINGKETTSYSDKYGRRNDRKLKTNRFVSTVTRQYTHVA
jgi:hypothetical protein